MSGNLFLGQFAIAFLGRFALVKSVALGLCHFDYFCMAIIMCLSIFIHYWFKPLREKNISRLK